MIRSRNKRNVSAAIVVLTLGFYIVLLAQQQLKPPQEKNFNQEDALVKLREQIKGREIEPAEKIFKNIQTLKGVPAGNLLKIMEFGYSRSLGVNCTHCHAPERWEAEDKPAKQIAREMVGMTATINSQLLKNIKNLTGANPVVNCTTCHRGQIIPAINLPMPNSALPSKTSN